MKHFLRNGILGAILLLSTAHANQMVTEVITIGHRDVNELLAVARSLVPAPGAVSSISNQLVVKTTPHNLRELKRVLAELDRAPRKLLITVRQGVSEELERQEYEALRRIGSGDVRATLGPPRGRRGLVISRRDDDGEVGVRALSEQARIEDQDVQRIQVLEGREAFIQAGEAVPYTERRVIDRGNIATVQDSMLYRDVTSGFYVVPRVSGDRVKLAIASQQSRLAGRDHGNIGVQQAQTTVSGRLGHWIELGGVATQTSLEESGIAYTARGQAATRQSIWVKVEELTP